MKITDIKTYVVENELGQRDHNKPAATYVGGKYFLFLELHTDEGIIGLGEKVTGSSFNDTDWKQFSSQISLLHETAEAFVIGENPFDIERIWEKMYANRHDYRHPSLHFGSILAGIEMACWDIVGKATNQPIYNLLGGKYWEKLRAYAYMPNPSSPEEAGEICEKLIEEGNSACKIDPFGEVLYSSRESGDNGFSTLAKNPRVRDIPLEQITYAEKIFENIRKTVGNKIEVGIGTHGQLTTYSAIRVAKALEPYQPFWFEEPVSPENIDEMARVARSTSIPIASGERLVTKYEFSELLRKQAAQIIQIDVGQAGGILEAKKVAGMAESYYAVIAPHMYCGPIASAAAIQVDVCSPNFLIQEMNQGPLHKKIFKEPLKLDKGYVIPPTGPGLGVELDYDVVKNRIVDK
ncbi:MAG: hypothetical protein CL740_00625 [Chloroflexi bacterium]|nr:hypothetical protein [Chloroflexota bacterium]